MLESSTPEDVGSIHNTILALDAHLDIEATFFTPEQAKDSGWQKLASLEKIEDGGLGAAFFVAYTDQGPLTGEGYARAYETVVEKIDTIRRVIDGPLRAKVGLALHPDDVRALHDSGRIAAIIALENGYALGEDLERLRTMYSLGVRYVTLSQVGHNQICDSKWAPGQPEALHVGLSAFGEQVVATMNELGCVIDVAHISKPSVLDVFRLSKSPVLVSHSGVQGVGGVGNILDDEELDDLAEHGFFIDNTVDHMAVSDMPKLTRKMKANVGLEAGFNFQMQHYLRYWLHPSAPTVQCLDSNELYDAEFSPPYVQPISPTVAFPVDNWPPLVRCYDGYYPGGSQPYQGCDDPGFADPTDLNLNRADSRWVCQGPPILEHVYMPLVTKP